MNYSIFELLQKRKASRAFSEKKLDSKIIEKLMNSTQLSASCFNNQPWQFLFLTDEDALEKGRKALSKGNSWAQKAPLLVVGFSKPDADCQIPDGREYFLFDLGMAVQLLLLQATELDLIARPMAGFSPNKIRNEFKIAEEYHIYVMIAVGYEGDISQLDERLQKVSVSPRKRNILASNFFMNEFEE